MKESKVVAAILCAASLTGVGAYYLVTQSQRDTEPPVLSAETEELDVGISATDEELKAGVAALDNRDGNVSGSIMIDNIQKKSDGSGDFQITYVAFDHSSNQGKLTRTLHYTDYRAPRFGLTTALRFPAGKQINLLSCFSANDCIDGNLTPFITLGGDTEVLDKKPKQGHYDCTVSVTNSVGDTVTLPIRIEVYDGNTAAPQIQLSNYLVYIAKGAAFDPNAYLQQVEEYEKVKPIVDADAWTDAESQISIAQIVVESNVDVNTPGTYTVSYIYRSATSGLDCTVQLIVVVE
nr:hypothetical protein [uncultured Mediterraneibacter sp.]